MSCWHIDTVVLVNSGIPELCDSFIGDMEMKVSGSVKTQLSCDRDLLLIVKQPMT